MIVICCGIEDHVDGLKLSESKLAYAVKVAEVIIHVKDALVTVAVHIWNAFKEILFQIRPNSVWDHNTRENSVNNGEVSKVIL
jgi:hypothetical protein